MLEVLIRRYNGHITHRKGALLLQLTAIRAESFAEAGAYLDRQRDPVARLIFIRGSHPEDLEFNLFIISI